jgi:hypothetical protein
VLKSALSILPALALCAAVAAARAGAGAPWSLAAAALAIAAATAIWTDVSAQNSAAGAVAAMIVIWARGKTVGFSVVEIPVSFLASMLSFCAAIWLADLEVVRARGREMGSHLGMAVRRSVSFSMNQGPHTHQAWMSGVHGGRKTGGTVSFNSLADRRGVVSIWAETSLRVSLRAYVCEDIWGNRPLDPTLQLVEPAPWKGLRLYADDKKAAVAWASALSPGPEELDALRQGARLRVSQGRVRWNNKWIVPLTRLKHQLDFVVRASAAAERA